MSKIVKRTLDFLEVFADRGKPLSLTEIARALQLPASSCHDVLQALMERGYVYELSPRGGFYPTLKLSELATRIVANDPILPRAEMQLAELRDRFDASVLLSRIDGEKATYLLVREPSYPLRFLRRVGETVRHLHATSVGKAVLGSMDERQRRRVIDKIDMTPLTEHTLRSRDLLAADIETSHRRGWYMSREESVPTVTTLSAVFRWVTSSFVLTMAGPTFRMEADLDDRVAALIAACQNLSDPGATKRERSQ